MSEICNIDNFKVKTINSTQSPASARVLINQNFADIESILKCMSDYLDDGESEDRFVFPVSPIINQAYILRYNGAKYDIVPQENTTGIKYIIREDESIFVPADYQYIVYDNFFVYGEVIMEGELIIL